MPGLTNKQAAFVREYLVDMNATQAYIRAGYKARGNSAEVNAARLLRNAQVAAEVQAEMDARAARTAISADYVLESIKRIAESAEASEELTAALKGHELLGKHLKLFTDKVEHSGKVEAVRIVVK